MKSRSRRARRMERHHGMLKPKPLNLVSLMDIFTILVFFLLVNSSSAPQLPRQKDLTLPSSISQKVPEESVVLAITPDRILLQGKEVMQWQSLDPTTDEVIAPLQEELVFHGKNRQLDTAKGTKGNGETEGLAVTIMGDENIAYGLLHRILQTCQAANYTRIAFAAQQKDKAGIGN